MNARVISRTPALSRRARMRKPSYLISCSQPGPEGGALPECPALGGYAHATTFQQHMRELSLVRLWEPWSRSHVL